MNMTEIAERATAARNALADLAKSVAKVPSPAFNFARSIELLGQLADWADTGRQRSGFSEAETLHRALEGTLEKACAGRRAAPVEAARERETEAPAVEVSSDPDLSARKKMAEILGQKGGESRSPEKLAAARANMQKINERRWGSKRRKPAKRRLARRRS